MEFIAYVYKREPLFESFLFFLNNQNTLDHMKTSISICQPDGNL